MLNSIKLTKKLFFKKKLSKDIICYFLSKKDKNDENLSIEEYEYLIAKDRSINNISKCYKRLKEEDQTLDRFVLKINDNILYINAKNIFLNMGYEPNKIWNMM